MRQKESSREIGREIKDSEGKSES